MLLTVPEPGGNATKSPLLTRQSCPLGQVRKTALSFPLPCPEQWDTVPQLDHRQFTYKVKVRYAEIVNRFRLTMRGIDTRFSQNLDGMRIKPMGLCPCQINLAKPCAIWDLQESPIQRTRTECFRILTLFRSFFSAVYFCLERSA